MGHRLKFEEVEVSGYSEGEARARLQEEGEEAIHLEEEEGGQASLKGDLGDGSSFCHAPCQAPWPRFYPHPLRDHDNPVIRSQYTISTR